MLKKGCIVVLGFLALVFVGALAAGWIVDGKYRVLRASPRVSHESVLTQFPSVRGQVNFMALGKYLVEAVEERLGREVPLWAIEKFLPYEGAAVVHMNDQTGQLELSGFLNEQRLGPILSRRFGDLDLQGAVPQVAWGEEGLRWVEPGVMLLRGTLPTDRAAEESAFMVWNQGFQRSPLPLEGGHLVEVVADNRDGGAYIAMTSFLKAFDIRLDKQKEEISLSTLQFVISARLTADLGAGDTLSVRLVLDIVPLARNRLGVASLKGALTEGLEEWGHFLAREKEIELRGGSEWKGTEMHFHYTIGPVTKVIERAMRGSLFSATR